MAAKQVIQTFAKRMMSSAAVDSARYVSPVSSLGQVCHRVSPFEQRLLVWSGHFKRISDVPSNVSRDMMERARNHFRIRLNVGIAGAAVLASLFFVISGKNAAHRGENINEYNQRWHDSYNQAHKFDPLN